MNPRLMRRPDDECVRKVCYQPTHPAVVVPADWEARAYFPDLLVPRHGDQLAHYFFDWNKELHRGQDQP